MIQIKWEILPSDHFPAGKGRFAPIWMVPGGGLVLANPAGDLNKKSHLKFVYFLLAQKDASDFTATDYEGCMRSVVLSDHSLWVFQKGNLVANRTESIFHEGFWGKKENERIPRWAFFPWFNMHESNFNSSCYNESLHIFKQPSTLILGEEKIPKWINPTAVKK